MSVNVGVGDLALFLEEPGLEPDEVAEYRQTYTELERFLRRRGLPGHVEPERLPPMTSHTSVESFPASWLHALRSALVRHRRGMPLSGVAAQSESALNAEYANPSFVSHLVHFSDTEGFYVPIDFPEPLVAAAHEVVLGGVVGSSIRLEAELEELAPALGIRLQDGHLPPELATELGDHHIQGQHSLGTERLVWLILFEAACQSIEHKSAIRLG